ncbi:MAG: amidohydrolase family protein, partial [Steroidobacteraceae bacterium]
MTFSRASALAIAAGLSAAWLVQHDTQAAGPTAPTPAAGPSEIIVLRAARMFDAVSGTLRTDATLVVRGEKIVAVGGTAPVPAAARVIELGDATLLPGFIDAHVHIAYEFDADYYRHNWNLLTRNTSEQALYSSVFARRTLEAGFTTIRNVGATGDYIDVGVRNAIDAGVIPGPRMLIAVHAISA